MQISEAQRIQTALQRLTQGRASNLDNLDALVSSRAPAVDVTTLLGRLTAPRAGYLDNINQAGLLDVTAARAASLDNLDAAISSRSAHAAADVRQSVTLGTDPADSIGKRIFDNLDKSIASLNDLAQADILSDATPFAGANIANLDAAVSSRSSHAAADVRQSVTLGTDPVDSIGRRVFDNLDKSIASLNDLAQAEILSDAIPFAGGNIDAAISTRSSHSAVDVRQSVTAGTDPADSIGRRIFDNLDAAISGIPTNPALDTYYTGTRGAYLDNLIGTQTAGTYSHPSGVTEGDAVVVTPTELGEYNKLCLDMSNLTQTTTVRTYVQVDGTNYRLVDSAEFPTDFPTNTAAVVIDLTPGDRTMKVTLQSAVAEGVAVDVPYFYVERSLA